MTAFPLKPSGPVSRISLNRRRFLGTAGAAGAGLLIRSGAAVAQSSQSDPCEQALAALAHARADAENPRPWAQDQGREAVALLQKRVEDALRALEQAEQREDDLEAALAVDVVATVGSSVFFVLGFTKVATAVGLAGVTVAGAPVLAVAGAVFGAAVLYGQVVTDRKTAGLGDGFEAVGGPALLIEHGVDAMPKEGVWMVGQGVRGFATFAKHSLGFLAAGFSAVEAWQTNQAENMAEEDVQRLREELSALQTELQQRMSLAYLASLRQAAAEALIEDLETGAAECRNGVILPRTTTADLLRNFGGAGDGGTAASGTAPGASTSGPVMREAPPVDRTKRLKLIRN